MVRVVLDTGVFYYPASFVALAKLGAEVVVPAVAMAERVRQLRRDGRDEQTFHDALALGSFRPEALTPEAACGVARRVRDDATWRRHSRDALIAAHLQPGDKLWTTNPKDFVALGVAPDQIVAVPF